MDGVFECSMKKKETKIQPIAVGSTISRLSYLSIDTKDKSGSTNFKLI